jgi:hypothetical protein
MMTPGDATHLEFREFLTEYQNIKKALCMSFDTNAYGVSICGDDISLSHDPARDMQILLMEVISSNH